MLPTRYFAFLNRAGTLVRAAACCGTALAFLSMASAPAFAAEMDNLKQQLRNLQNRLDQLESQQAAPPVIPKKVVRSGKAPVTLTLSGQFSRISFFADDGFDDGFFNSDNEMSSTRWRFVGAAKINSEWSAGGKIELDVEGNSSDGVTIDQDTSKGDNDTDQRQMNVYIKSKSLGKLTLGKTDAVSNNIAQIDLSGTSIAEYSGIQDVGGSLQFRNSATGANVSKVSAGSTQTGDGVWSQFDGMSRRNVIRYDSPSLAGFTASASHIQGDAKDVALRYKANYKQAGLKVAAGIAYWQHGERSTSFEGGIGGSVSLLHSSGANITFSAGTAMRDDEASQNDPWGFFVKPGFQFKATSLGKTAVSGHYARADDLGTSISDPEFQSFGFELVQNIDAAALELFVFFSNWSLDSSTSGEEFDDINMGGFGARLKF